MVKRRDVLQAVSGLRLDSESESAFRKQCIEVPHCTLLLGNKGSLEFYIRFSAMPVSLFVLQPLSASGISARNIHYCLGELYATLATNRAVRFNTGFIVTKTFGLRRESRGQQLWVVQDFTSQPGRDSLPQHRLRRLCGQQISCAQITTLTREARFSLESAHCSGFRFWPLDIGKMTEHSTRPAHEETIDELRFQDLYHTKLEELLLGIRTRPQREAALVGHLDTAEISPFLDRYEKGGEWVENFAQSDIVEALRSLDLNSSNHDLRRVRDRISSGTQANRELQIKCPDGKTKTYTFEWCLAPKTCLALRDDDVLYTEEQFESLEDQRGLTPEDRDLTGRERYCLPPGTVVTLVTPLRSALCTPIGIIGARNIQCTFIVIRFLESKKFGVVYNTASADPDDAEDAHAPHNRVAPFPGTDMQVSVGDLVGLFENQVARLENIEARGFRVIEAVRLGGEIQEV